MSGATSRTFKSGNSEAVRLPKGLGFGIGAEVRIEREGDRVVLTPLEDASEVKRGLRRLIEDLRAIRGDVSIPREERDTDWWPDRSGL